MFYTVKIEWLSESFRVIVEFETGKKTVSDWVDVEVDFNSDVYYNIAMQFVEGAVVETYNNNTAINRVKSALSNVEGKGFYDGAIFMDRNIEVGRKRESIEVETDEEF